MQMWQDGDNAARKRRMICSRTLCGAKGCCGNEELLLNNNLAVLWRGSSGAVNT